MRIFQVVLHASLCAVLMFASLNSAHAEWKIVRGKKIMSLGFGPSNGMVATRPANGAAAELRLECFESPQLSGIQFGIVLPNKPPNGFMAWKYKYDHDTEIQKKPSSRTLPPEIITLGDASSGEYKGLLTANRLRLTLLPADGSQMPYEFDVSGAAKAVKSIACKERNLLR